MYSVKRQDRRNGLKGWLVSLSVMMSVLAAAAVTPVHAKGSYPDRPITIIVGFPPGGGGDLYGRLIAKSLEKTLKQAVVVDNRPGAGGTLAGTAVARAKPDGYTLLLAMSGNLAVAPAVKPEATSYKVPGDFAGVGLITEAPLGLFVATDSPYKDARELFDAARNNEMAYASTGAGGSTHIGMELVNMQAELNLLHVPYGGAGPALTDLVGGRVDMLFTSAPPMIAQARNNIVRAVAFTGDERVPVMPDVPTFKELGVARTFTQWYGLVAPAGTPESVLQVLAEHVSLAQKDPEVLELIHRDGGTANTIVLKDFEDYFTRDYQAYRDAVALMPESSLIER